MPYIVSPHHYADPYRAGFFGAAHPSLVRVYLVLAGFLLALHAPASAQESHRHVDSSHNDGLHFSHPLVAESPSPDTKIRFDYALLDVDGAGPQATVSTFRLEAEYAFYRVFSVEVDVPYTWLDPEQGSSRSNLDNVQVGLKFANFAFEERGLLLGYGIEFGFPTGDSGEGIGSGHIFEIEPFLDVGYKWRDIEVVAFTEFGIPTNQEEGEEVETELGYNVSALYHFSSGLQGLIEVDGESVLSGEESGESLVNISPGIKIRPLPLRELILGLSVGVPVSEIDQFDTRVRVSVFYHF